jgi:hypothetical protein
VRIIDDRLAQYRRILVKNAQPDPAPGDNIIRVPPEMWGTLDLSQPLVRGGAVVPLGTAVDPVADSFALSDNIGTNGVAGLDSHTILFASAGLWHMHVNLNSMFSGTTNTGGSDLVQLQGGINPQLGTPVFQPNIFNFRFITGHQLGYAADFWLPMLDAWNLTRLITARVAGDLFAGDLAIIGRRFL